MYVLKGVSESGGSRIYVGEADEPAQLTDDLIGLGAVLAHIEVEGHRLLRRGVVTADVLSQPVQQLELLRQLWGRRDAAG